MLELFKAMTLDKNSKTALYTQLYEKLKEYILTGTLVADYRLPSIRNLSMLLEINQITVVSAFKQLEREGYLYSKLGSGTFVSNILTLSHNTKHPENNTIMDELYQQDDILLLNNGQITIRESTINFASATPSPDLFPIDNFKAVLNEVLERDKGNAFGYQDSLGFYPIRECIHESLKKNSIYCNPDNIQIISGAQQGIDIISKALLRQGDYVVTESPTYTGAIAVFRSRGAEIIDVEMNFDGSNLNILEYNLKKYRPKLIYSIPTFQNPTGFSYSNKKREDLLRLADKYDTYIIEDDYISGLDFENKGFRQIKALDKNNRVIFLKSFSKIFMPGLRLGFMIVPISLQDCILEAKHTTDISTSGLIQRTFDLYIRKGFWDNHFDFMYGIYKERYLKTITALDAFLPPFVKYYKPGGGLNIWLNFPYSFPINKLFKLCASEEIVFAPGKIFFSGSSTQKLNCLRLSFAAVPLEKIDDGIKKLCAIINLVQSGNEDHNNIRIL
jgi:2-aminoadipate transaminase